MVRDRPLAGKTALVTGASRGIGRAVCERLAADGARIVACARDPKALRELCGELCARLPDSAAPHLPLALDLGDREAIARGLETLAGEAIDLIVSNAGIAESRPYDRTEDDLFERMFAVNALASARLGRALIPKMASRGFGRVVIVASNAALTGYPYSSAYCASKHAVLGWMRAVALEIAKTGVTINALCPGWVDTDMAAAAISRIAGKTGRSSAEARAALESMSPQGRMAQPEQIAYWAATLCRPEAASVHGQALCIDGGQLLR